MLDFLKIGKKSGVVENYHYEDLNMNIIWSLFKKYLKKLKTCTKIVLNLSVI